MASPDIGAYVESFQCPPNKPRSWASAACVFCKNKIPKYDSHHMCENCRINIVCSDQCLACIENATDPDRVKAFKRVKKVNNKKLGVKLSEGVRTTNVPATCSSIQSSILPQQLLSTMQPLIEPISPVALQSAATLSQAIVIDNQASAFQFANPICRNNAYVVAPSLQSQSSAASYSLVTGHGYTGYGQTSTLTNVNCMSGVGLCNQLHSSSSYSLAVGHGYTVGNPPATGCDLGQLFHVVHNTDRVATSLHTTRSSIKDFGYVQQPINMDFEGHLQSTQASTVQQVPIMSVNSTDFPLPFHKAEFMKLLSDFKSDILASVQAERCQPQQFSSDVGTLEPPTKKN